MMLLIKKIENNLNKILIIFIVKVIIAMQNEKRRIFNYDNLSETKIITSLKEKSKLYTNTISACGCLFYNKNNKKLLLISYEDKNWPNYDDFGGIIDEDDETIFNTIIRETAEETNGVISENDMRRFIKQKKYKQFYSQKSKYFLIAINVDSNFYPNTKIFGTLEETDNIARTVEWFDYESVQNKLSPRLKYCDELINFLNLEFNAKSTKKKFPFNL